MYILQSLQNSSPLALILQLQHQKQHQLKLKLQLQLQHADFGPLSIEMASFATAQRINL